MTEREASIASDVRPSLGVAALFATMLLTLPLVSVQGPAHMTVMDAVNFVVIAGCWTLILARQDAVRIPLLVPFWLIMLGSVGSLFAATYVKRSLLTLVEDLYLFVWFVTLVHLLARSCRIGTIGAIWAFTATAVALLTIADHYTGIAGGRFAGSARAVGTFANPNMFGNYLLLSFFLTWSVAAAGKRYLYAALLPIGLGILETASNGALLGFMGGMSAMLASDARQWQPRRLGLILVVGGIVLTVVVSARHSLEDAMHDMMSNKRGEIGGAALKGAEERIPLWIASAQVFAATPIGVGPNNFDDAIGPILGDYHGAHSEYVGMIVERGPLGLAGWCALLGSVAFVLHRMRGFAAAGFRPLAIEPLYGALGAMAVQAFVIELLHFRHFWLLLALIFAVVAQAERSAAAPSQPLPARTRVPVPAEA